MSEFNKADLTLRDIAENGLKDEFLACTAVLDLRTELNRVTSYVFNCYEAIAERFVFLAWSTFFFIEITP